MLNLIIQERISNMLPSMQIKQRDIAAPDTADKASSTPKQQDNVTNGALDISEDGSIDMSSVLQETQVMEVLDKLDQELVGLKSVKTRIREIAALLLVERMRRRFELTTQPPTLHMSFTGPPGTGKTTVALRMATILHRLSYVRKGHLVAVTRDDLVGQYIGHTAPKTKEILKRAMGGVLFIDEAYYLYRQENERDYGQEAIEILLQVMETQREDLVVILAGYKDRMETFFSSNPGFSSRIAHHLDFPDYTLEELLAIAQLMLAEQMYRFSPEGETAFEAYLTRRMQMPRFSNARSVRNALDRARLRQANRLFAKGGKISRIDLMTIEAEDILASRVFSENLTDEERSNDGS
jgi:probable Rubsico expression protein CbbX